MAIAPGWKSLKSVAERYRGRPALFALAVLTAITGIGVGLTIWAPNIGHDAGQFRDCAQRLAQGKTDCGLLYSPLMVLAARPLTWVSAPIGEAAMSLLGALTLGVGVVLGTRGRATVDRMLVAIAAFTFAPVVYELLLGQTTLLIAATLYPLARRPDGYRYGIPLGIAIALAPKPLLLPILVWMLVWRRRALVATMLTTAALTAGGILLIGWAAYAHWLSVVIGAGSAATTGTLILSARDTGNLSLWPLTPITVAVGALVAVGTLRAIRIDASRGFVASLFAGLLLAPYSILYAFSILLLTVEPGLKFTPRATWVLAFLANFVRVSPVATIAWGVAAIAACASLRLPKTQPDLPS